MSYESYNAFLLVNGISNRDKNITHAKNSLSTTFTDSPSYYPVSINSSTDFKDVWIVDDSDTKDQKVITSLDYDLQNGDIVDWQSSRWINIITDYLGDIYTRGTIKRCVSLLKWIDNAGDIQETPFAFNSESSSNFGVNEDRIITLSNERRNIILQSNEHTYKVTRDKRFIFDDRVWKVTALDRISKKGLIIITLQEDEINPAKDNLELGIADYYDNVAQFRVEIINGKFATIKEDQTLQLNIIVKNRDTPLPSLPHIIYSVSDNEIIDITTDGLVTPKKTGLVVVKVSYKDVFAEIEISVTESTAYAYTCEIIGVSEIKKNRTQSYSVKFYRNGVEYHDDSEFLLTSDDGVSETDLATISVQDSSANTCSIFTGNTIGYFWLHVKNQNGLSESKLRIKVKPLY
ncbi:hypothetical protein [Paenibacillus donghaensis]|uniref:BIG2 domain-containing protein n=1 Tax=Paenibacillus donghaensis TaxID=414771 RepID=A0A2Z2KNH8_9BACL|nr:hypothetical protein [Paenibacillus donghaensis]ASA22752.1 hypothetical protein B9T62_19285 [Paenibacillus donghaensis]